MSPVVSRLSRRLCRAPLAALTFLLVAGALVMAAPAGAVTTTNNATTLANAALKDPSILSGASFDTAANAKATGVATEPLAGFPVDGSNYLIMSSGDASLAPNASQAPNASVDNGGGTRGGAENVVALRLNLNVPAGANCMSLRFRFLSEEYPEYVGQGYNDGFLAELDPATPWTMVNHQITAPANFAFVPGGAFVSINSAPMTAGNAAGTVYDGGTELLGATTPVTPGAHSLVLSVWDDGDKNLDSAAFVDGIQTFASGSCGSGVVVDTTPPETTVTAHPAAVAGGNASFAFEASEGGSTFECRLDGGAWASCEPPKAYSGLPGGSHTFEVRAIDLAGNVDPSPASYTWTVDATPPETILDSGPAPAPTASTSAEFAFHSDDSSASFECQLDSSAWAPCGSPRSYTGLGDGPHTFRARAVDTFGNVDATPVETSWTVDTTPPDSSILSGPAGATGDSATFGFTANEASTYECQLDAGAWQACASPASYSGLPEGPHTFAVRATDALGNVETTPATRSFAVDLTPPETTIVQAPASPTKNTTASFDFEADEVGATFECRLDGGAWTACASGRSYGSLGDGEHLFEVRSIDGVGNVDPTPAQHQWTVDLVAPLAPTVDLTKAPAALSNDPNPTIAFDGEPGATFECQLDAGAWGPCSSPLALTGLEDGSHELELRQVDVAGNVSLATAYEWTVDTEAPVAPTILVGPPATTPESEASFAFAGDPGATFECRLDDALWGPCTATLDLQGVGLGEHMLQVRQTDAAGNPSAAVEQSWTVQAVEPPLPPAGDGGAGTGVEKSGHAGKAPSLTGYVGERTSPSEMPTAVADGSLVPAACKVSRGGIERCQVIVRVAGKVVGRGTATYGAAGTRAGRVEVRLSKALQKKLENSAVHATFAFQAVTTGGGKSITARRSVMLAARQQWIVPLNGLFESTRSRLTPRVLHYLAQVAPQLRSARVIRCIGNTDSLGSSAENRRLGMQRARQVCGQLRRLGVRARLVAVSRGESRPRSTNATIQGRWSNRRVELRVSR